MSILDDVLARMGKTPIGAFGPPTPTPEGTFDRFTSLANDIENRFPGIDQYRERVNRASEMQTTVRRIVDGDTLETDEGSIVRLVGIDAPESVHPTQAPQPFGSAASDRLEQLLPPGTGINLEPGFEDTDARGRLLRFVESEGGQINKQLIAAGLAGLTDFDQPRRKEFIDALEQVIHDQLGAFSFQEQLAQRPTLESLNETALAAGLPSIFTETGEPTNPIFAEAFQKAQQRAAFGALHDKAAEASEIINDLRREVLEEEKQPLGLVSEGADIDELSELLPIKAGLQAALGEEITAPVPQTAEKVNIRPQIVDGEIQMVDEGGGLIGGHDRGLFDLAGLAEASGIFRGAISSFSDLDPETENVAERFITRFSETEERIGEGISKPDLAVQRLIQATARDIGDVIETFSTEGSDADAFAQGLKESSLVDSDLELLERISPQGLARPDTREFEPTGPGIQAADIGELGGTVGPSMVLAALGPGGLPAASLASTRVGRTLVRVGVNAVENFALEGLDPGPGGEIDALNALAIGAAAGGVFDGAGRLIDNVRPALLTQNTVDAMVTANPELAARMLSSVTDQLDMVGRAHADALEAFARNPVELIDQVDGLIGLKTVDDLPFSIDDTASFIRRGELPQFREMDTINASPELKKVITGELDDAIIGRLAKKSGLELDDIISDASLASAREASEAAEPSHRVRVYKDNLVASAENLIKQQDFAGAWRVLHRAEVGKHLGKKETLAVKEALINAVEAVDPSKAQSLRALEAQADEVLGKPTITTFKDIIESPEQSAKIQEFLRANKEITDATKFNPESGAIRNPFASRAAERFLNLTEAEQMAVKQGVLKDAKPYSEQLTKWHNTVRDNLGRLDRAGLVEAKDISKILDDGRFFEEEFQGGIMADFLNASKELRPMSQYLLEGGSHHVESVRKFAGLGAKQKQWMKDSRQTWDAITKMRSARELESFMRDGSPIGRMLDKMFGRKVGIDGDNFFMSVQGPSGRAQINFTMQDLHAAMGKVAIAKGDSADIIDAWSSLVLDQTTNFARKNFNAVAVAKLDDALKLMKGAMSSSDVQFMTQLRTSLTDTSTTHDALTMLRSAMAMTRLPLVSISNLPQMSHAAIMFGARNTARALWRMHGPRWAGNVHRGRVREMALNDASAADSVIQEQADILADFARTIDPSLAEAAGRPDLQNVPGAARLAQRFSEASRSFVGNVVGLKPTERWLRTLASEAGRLHNASVLRTTQKLISTPEGENALRIAWKIADDINPEDPFFKNAFGKLKDGPGMRVQSLVHDLRMLGQWENVDDVLQLRQFTPHELDKHVNKFFDAVSVTGPTGVAKLGEEIPEVLIRAMGRSGKFAAEASQFRVGLQDLPLSLNAPGTGRDLYRTIMQFRTFNYKHFNQIWRRYVKDEAKRGNLIPLMRVVAVGAPFGTLTGGLTLELKSWIQGSEPTGGSWIDLAADVAFGRITQGEMDRRLEKMGRADILAMRSVDNFQAWGGFGTPGEVIELATRGPGATAGLVGGAGPSSLAAGAYSFLRAGAAVATGDRDEAIGQGLRTVENVVGNPLGITKTATRRIREAEDVGRDLETFRPTALERLINDPDQERARVIEQDAELRREEATEGRQNIRELLERDKEREGLPDQLTPRAEAGRESATRDADRQRIREDYLTAVLNGDLPGQQAAKSEARQLRLEIDFKRLRRAARGRE